MEIIVSVALISIAFVVLLGIAFSVINVSSSIQKQTKANALMNEGFEAIRNFRDGTQWLVNGLGTMTTGSSSPYHLVNNSNTWNLVEGPETIGIFTRQIVLDKVSRNSNYQIEQTYNLANDDNNTRKITITVSWQDTSLQNITYLTNWK